jgi:hypothetical protein
LKAAKLDIHACKRQANIEILIRKG